jgi:hypothetical protein
LREREKIFPIYSWPYIELTINLYVRIMNEFCFFREEKNETTLGHYFEWGQQQVEKFYLDFFLACSSMY